MARQDHARSQCLRREAGVHASGGGDQVLDCVRPSERQRCEGSVRQPVQTARDQARDPRRGPPSRGPARIPFRPESRPTDPARARSPAGPLRGTRRRFSRGNRAARRDRRAGDVRYQAPNSHAFLVARQDGSPSHPNVPRRHRRVPASARRGAASLKPLFLPVNGILEVALIMGLTTSIVGLFLRNLEIHNALRDNQRFLMAKSSMTRAFRTAAFAIGLAVALLLAITPSLAATLLSDPPQVVSLPPSASEVVTFTSPDPLGLTFVTYAAVGVTSGSVSVMVKRDNVTVAAPQTLTSTQRAVLDIEPSMWADHATWSLVFRNTQNASTFLTFVLQKGIVPTLFSTVPFLVFLYGAVQIGWWVVLRPIRERTKVTSLRSAAEIDSGERLYDPSAPMPDAPALARADRMTSSFVEPPPPSPSAPPPP